MNGQPLRFIRGHAMRLYARPPLGEDDYVIEDRGYDTACWIRKGFRNNRGYTRVAIAGKSVFAHRAMYEQSVGPIPEGMVIDHHCRQHDCINPEHLEPVSDAINKHRGKGTKLTAEQVRAIRADTRCHRLIAECFGISRSHVSRLRSGKKWRLGV